MHTSESTDKLFTAIAKAQAEMPTVAKTAINPHFRSKFAPLDAVHKAAQPILAKHGLALLAVTSAADSEAVTMVRLQCGDQWLECTLAMKPKSTDPQQIGSCNTYARRYLYGMLFGLVTEEDTDGTDTTPEPPKNASKPKGKPKAPATKPKPYKAALDEPTVQHLTALGWKYEQCMECWEAHPDKADFQAAVAAARTEQLKAAGAIKKGSEV